MEFSVSGNIVDVVEGRIYPGKIFIRNGVIIGIKREKVGGYANFILPGFIDSHIHIESSMLPPGIFAKQAVRFGTVATISDPHEIANVCGIEGIKYMIEEGERTPFKFFFGAPSCVPATAFETSGAKIDAKDIEFVFKNFNITYLSEMMNFPGVINEVPDVIAKIDVAKKFGYPIDGHCPGLRGEDLKKYISKGITTDHESLSRDEAEEKILNQMKILIREGSAAKNFDALMPLLGKYPHMVMFCSDDLHPFELQKGHINLLVKKAVGVGYDLFDVLRAVSLNPVVHYQIPVGLLRVGDDADFIIVDNLEDFNVLETYIQGKLVANKNGTTFEIETTRLINNFNIGFITKEQLNLYVTSSKKIRVIEAIDGSLATNSIVEEAKVEDGFAISDPERDILKIVVVNRYSTSAPSIGFVKGFGLKKGALATSVAHDSHNIIALGVSDEVIVRAVNLIIESKGGMAFVDDNKEEVLPLPIAGLMSDLPVERVSEVYLKIEEAVKNAGSKLTSPLMTLSFMSLLVIPSLKISDRGLFDVDKFQFTSLFVE